MITGIALIYIGLILLAAMAGAAQAVWVHHSQGVFLGPDETLGMRLAFWMSAPLVLAIPGAALWFIVLGVRSILGLAA